MQLFIPTCGPNQFLKGVGGQLVCAKADTASNVDDNSGLYPYPSYIMCSGNLRTFWKLDQGTYVYTIGNSGGAAPTAQAIYDAYTGKLLNDIPIRFPAGLAATMPTPRWRAARRICKAR